MCCLARPPAARARGALGAGSGRIRSSGSRSRHPLDVRLQGMFMGAFSGARARGLMRTRALPGTPPSRTATWELSVRGRGASVCMVPGRAARLMFGCRACAAPLCSLPRKALWCLGGLGLVSGLARRGRPRGEGGRYDRATREGLARAYIRACGMTVTKKVQTCPPSPWPPKHISEEALQWP